MDTVFRHSFDAVAEAEPGTLNRNLVSLARFLNMHARAGVPAENLQLALVIHGTAVNDVTRADHYGARHDGAENINVELIEQLQAHGVQFYVCGQSASRQSIDNEDLLPGVTMALSAMTAHALLQQDGYTMNPF